jgi:UDP-N-acetylglucosamine 2-epimerase (non-hydrolysing)
VRVLENHSLISAKPLLEIVELLPDFIVVYPVHLNPNIKSTAQRYLIHPRIHLTDPLSYPHLLWFIDKSDTCAH